MKKLLQLCLCLLSINLHAVNKIQAKRTRVTPTRSFLSKKFKPHNNKDSEEQYAKDRIIAMTIPKCGTFLLTKCINLLGISGRQYKKLYRDKEDIDSIRRQNQLPPPNHYKGRLHLPTVGPLPHWWVKSVIGSPSNYTWAHISHSYELEKFIDQHSKAMILMIRDPRDMVVSFAHMIQSGKASSTIQSNINPGQSIELEPLLLDLIDGRQKNYISWASEILEAYPVVWEVGVCNYFRQFLPYMKFKKCLTLRFEDLVGEQGGGSFEAQFTAISHLVRHTGNSVNDAKIRDVCAQLFGDSGTFREGKIGSWKKYFTPTIKAAFKAMPGSNKLLIELGYEKDNQW